MNKKLSMSSYLAVGSLLFGLFFGAGNLIFPVHLGQLAGANSPLAALGFIVTGVGLPFLGVLAIGFSQSNGLLELSSRVSKPFGLFFTLALYLTIGPFFAMPRTATVSFEVGIAPQLSESKQQLALLIFSLAFFILAFLFSLKPSKIMVWIGKVLNPLFLIFLGVLILVSFIKPMGAISTGIPQQNYDQQAFFTGFLEGYNTMDALASLAFGIIIVQAIKELGVTKPTDIAKDTLKSGIVTLVLMSVIYGSLAYMGATSLALFETGENGGITLSQIATHYFGTFGQILLAIIITLACLKTAIGLITACSETFHQIFPKISYIQFVVIFSLLGCMIANLGLTAIISISIPVLMFLYPLAIAIILLAFLSPLFKHQSIVYRWTIGFTFLISLIEGFKSAPAAISQSAFVQWIDGNIYHYLPFSSINMGWICPMLLGLLIGLILYKKQGANSH